LARYIDSACRLCRREGLKLFLKGDRCYSEKCAFERRGYAPGDHGQMRRKQPSDYGIQLRENRSSKGCMGCWKNNFTAALNRGEKKRHYGHQSFVRLGETTGQYGLSHGICKLQK